MMHESLRGDIHISHELSRKDALHRDRRSWSPADEGFLAPFVESRYTELKGA
jgi:hypothetical protein